MALNSLLQMVRQEVEEPEEETFLLFSQSRPSHNLGIVDAKATELELTVSGRDLNIVQSPGLLSSDRKGGTTGAVVWKITPLFVEWITSKDNVFFRTNILDHDSQVLEMGCGIAGIPAVILAPRIGRYIATDQEYVFKLLNLNIKENALPQKSSLKVKREGKSTKANESALSTSNIKIIALDWETSSISNLSELTGPSIDGRACPLDAVIACDCIYNETLVDPFVRTCAEICRLAKGAPEGKQTLCIIAQQLRSDSVFEAWLSAFHKVFRVWRLPDDLLIEGLRQGSGFVVHIGVLRDLS